MPRPDDIFPFVDGEGRALLRRAAIGAAFDVGIVGALVRSPEGLPAEGLAQRLDVAPRRLRALLDVLVVEGVITCNGSRYRMDQPPPAVEPLPPEGWGQIAASILTDTAAAAAGLTRTESARYHAHLFQAGADAALEVAGLLARPGHHLLDAGGGSGAYTAAWLNAHHTTRATLLDHPDVVALARSTLASFGDRVSFIEGDVVHIPPESRYDVGLLANVLHLHGPDTCRRLVSRVLGTLAPGGTLAVKDFRIDAGRHAPDIAVLFALNMAIYTDAGDVHPPDDIAAWMREAGATNVREMRLTSSPDAVMLTGERPTDHQ